MATLRRAGPPDRRQSRHPGPPQPPAGAAGLAVSTGIVDQPEKPDRARLAGTGRYAQPHARTGRRQRGRAKAPPTRPESEAGRHRRTAELGPMARARFGYRGWRRSEPPRRAWRACRGRSALSQRNGIHARLQPRRGRTWPAQRWSGGWADGSRPRPGVRPPGRVATGGHRGPRSGAGLRANTRTTAPGVPARPVLRVEPAPRRSAWPCRAVRRSGRPARGNWPDRLPAHSACPVGWHAAAVLRRGRRLRRPARLFGAGC